MTLQSFDAVPCYPKKIPPTTILVLANELKLECQSSSSKNEVKGGVVCLRPNRRCVYNLSFRKEKKERKKGKKEKKKG